MEKKSPKDYAALIAGKDDDEFSLAVVLMALSLASMNENEIMHYAECWRDGSYSDMQLIRSSGVIGNQPESYKFGLVTYLIINNFPEAFKYVQLIDDHQDKFFDPDSDTRKMFTAGEYGALSIPVNHFLPVVAGIAESSYDFALEKLASLFPGFIDDIRVAEIEIMASDEGASMDLQNYGLIVAFTECMFWGLKRREQASRICQNDFKTLIWK